MKTVRLFIVALFLTVAASAQPNASSARDGSSPTVYMISVQETDTLIPCEWRARAARNRMAMMDAVDDYNQTHRTGFQQPGRPQFLFAQEKEIARGTGAARGVRLQGFRPFGHGSNAPSFSQLC